MEVATAHPTQRSVVHPAASGHPHRRAFTPLLDHKQKQAKLALSDQSPTRTHCMSDFAFTPQFLLGALLPFPAHVCRRPLESLVAQAHTGGPHLPSRGLRLAHRVPPLPSSAGTLIPSVSLCGRVLHCFCDHAVSFAGNAVADTTRWSIFLRSQRSGGSTHGKRKQASNPAHRLAPTTCLRDARPVVFDRPAGRRLDKARTSQRLSTNLDLAQPRLRADALGVCVFQDLLFRRNVSMCFHVVCRWD